MKKLLFLIVLVCAEKTLHAQQGPVIYTIRADSVKITNDCDTAELIIENHTQNVPGFLYNKGRGRTEFRRATRLNDSTLILGGDTIVLSGTTAANNGLHMNGKNVQLGGILINDSTTIDLNSKKLIINGGNGDRQFLIKSDNWGFATESPVNYFSQLNFYIKDTATRQGVIGTYNHANKDVRQLFISVGDDYTNAQYPATGAGMHFEIRTGSAGLNVTRFHRNGNVGIGTSAYRLTDKLAVAGNVLITDTLKLPNIKSKTDTTTYKPMAVDANGNIFKMSSWNLTGTRTSATVTGSSYTVPADINVVFVNHTSGQATITLPTGQLDREITIKNLHTSNTVLVSGLDTNESNSIATRGAITVKYTGSSWVGISKY